MVGILTKKKDVFQILDFAFQRKGIPTLYIEAGKEIPEKEYKVFFVDEEYYPLVKEKLPKGAIFLLSERILSQEELKDVQGYILVPFTLEFVLVFVDELYHRFWAKEEERRKDIRYHYELPVVFYFSQGKEKKGWILDISKGGFRAVLKDNGSTLEDTGKVEIQDVELNVSCSFVVRWRREEGNKVVFGASWKDLGEKEARNILSFLALHTGLFDL